MPKFTLNAFQFYDLWLLRSISSGLDGSGWADIICLGDCINHAIFMPEELNFGMSKLVYNGYVEQVEKEVFRSTSRTSTFYSDNERASEDRIQKKFIALPTKQDCPYIEYITEEEYQIAVNEYKNSLASVLKKIGL